MHTSVLVVFSFMISAHCVNTRAQWNNPDIKICKVYPVNPVNVHCRLTDIITLTAPIIASKRPKYKLFNPQGDVRILKIQPPKFKNKKRIQKSAIEIITFNKTKVIIPKNKYRIFNVNRGYKIKEKKDVFVENEKEIDSNEFMIGPVGVEDYGNWILSIIYQQDGDWIECYQVITVDITEYVPPSWRRPVLAKGDTFYLSFAYPISDIKSCQLIAPASTFDRFYDRQRVNMDNCGYVVKNVTKDDEGQWKIIAVGRITYATMVNLSVVDFLQLSGKYLHS